MRSLYKISLALLALGCLAYAGSAFAQEAAKPTMTLTGNIGAALGSFNFDTTSAVSGAPASTKAFSEVETAYEANLKWTYTTDKFTSLARIRIRQNSGGSGFTGPIAANNGTIQSGGSSSGNDFMSSGSDVYIESWWTPGDFKLGIGKYQGQDWSNPIGGEYIIRNIMGDGEYWMNWTGVPGLDAEYNLGIIQIGVAVSSQCVPSCNANPANNGVPGSASTTTAALIGVQKNQMDNTMSLVPHITGKVGDISFRAQLPQTSGTINNSGQTKGTATTTTNTKGVTCADVLANAASSTGACTNSTETKSATGSGYQAGVKWAGPGGLAVAVDLGSFTEAKVVDLGELKDRARNSYDLRLDVPAGPGSVMLAYFSIDDNNANNGQSGQISAAGAPTYSAHTYTATNTTLRYYIPVSFGQIVPEYRAVACGGCAVPASGIVWKDTTNSEFRLILNTIF